MIYEEHIAAAKTFLRAEKSLVKPEMGMIAAESVWGAAVQVIDAINHRTGSRHSGNNRDRERVVEYMASKYSVDDLFGRFNAAGTNLHNHFYTGRLNNQELYHYLARGISFVNQMIELAGQE